MQVYHRLDELNLAQEGRHTAVAFGSFDGLHVGHRLLLERVRHVAAEQNLHSLVLTFSNHPLSVLAPPYAPQLLLTPERKIQILEQLGIDIVVMPPFTMEVAHISARHFIREILLERLGMRHIVAGYDCRFGHKGTGDGEMLRIEGERLGFGMEEFQAQMDDGITVGSRVIRELLLMGNVEKAMELLERPHELRGTVIHGEERGRQLGFPTANLQFPEPYLIPANGVYAIWADVGNRRYGGMINLGRRPTFGTLAFLPEAHLFNFKGEIYGEEMTVYFLRRLRDEKRFESAEALKQQLIIDQQTAREALLSLR